MAKPYHFRIGQTEDGKPVKLDLATFVGTRAAIIANSGGGKSFALRTLIEQTAERVQWIVIDPEGEYSSLRERFPSMLLVGKEGELPVDVRSAKLLARKIMETRTSTIVDLYGLLDLRASWTAAFVSALLTLPKDLWSPVIIAVDEAQRLAPETPTGSKAEREALYQSRKAIITLADSGRKQSRGSIIASQRVSKLASDARAELRNRFIGLHVQDIDRDRAADDLGFSKAQARALRDLKAGQFYVYGPAFLGLTGITLMQFDLPQTHHPQPGEGHLLGIPPASDALKRVIEQMGDLPKQVEDEAHSLDALQRENAELKRQLRARPVQVEQKVETKIERVEVPVFKDGQLEALGQMTEQIGRLATLFGEATQDIRQSLDTAMRIRERPAPNIPAPVIAARMPVQSQARVARPAESTEGLTRPQQAILDALATFETLGIDQPQKSNVAVFAQQSPTSSGFTNNCGSLRSAGLIDYPGPGLVQLTQSGREAAHANAEIGTLGELHAAWFARLSKPKVAILSELIPIYPQAIRKENLAERVGVSAISSGYTNNLGNLRSLGLISYPKEKYVAATALLFPDLPR